MTDKAQGATEREQFETHMKDRGYDYPNMGRLRDGSYQHRGVNSHWATWQARAALKAQPAPTEEQGESPFKFQPWSKEAEMVEGWTAAEKARSEEQRKDRVQLADGYITGTVVSDPNASWIAIRYESMEQAAAAADLLFGMIDRARASAETGGVKS